MQHGWERGWHPGPLPVTSKTWDHAASVPAHGVAEPEEEEEEEERDVKVLPRLSHVTPFAWGSGILQQCL